MGESSNSRLNSRLGLRSTSGLGGEIVEVQGGGHVMRSIGRKDRHSKVCTAKGPRDRRVRLAAHTAIQFYDVQDRLGYDRPSKAVDWLINKAKAAIDELAELPPWHPTNSTTSCPNINFETGKVEHASGSHNNAQDSGFLPPSLDPDDHDADDDTMMKSFFPVGIASSSAMQFHNFHADMPSSSNNNNNNSSQDLRLSLQSLQDPNIGFDGTSSSNIPTHSQAQVLLSGGAPLGFDGNTGWLDHHQRLESWNHGAGASGGGAAGYLFYSPPAPQMLLQQLQGGHNNQLVSQRGPLQSINTPPVRAPNWMDPSTDDHGQLHHYPPSVFSAGNASRAGGFSRFRIPARIQGDDNEEHDGCSDMPSSTSSDSRH